jgi:hypothetical protein
MTAMKKILVLVALTALVALCFGCDKEPKDTTGLVGTWTLTDMVSYNEFGEMLPVDTVWPRTYIFYVNGRGWGKTTSFQSGYEFDWTLTGNKLTVDIDENSAQFPLPFIYVEVWTVEEIADTKLILSIGSKTWDDETETRVYVEGTGKGISYYTFSKVE